MCYALMGDEMGEQERIRDITIASVDSIYYLSSPYWRRDFFACRPHDGVVLFLEGSVEYHFADYSAAAAPGDVLILPAVHPYSGTKLTEGNIGFIVIDFDTAAEGEFARLGLPTILHAGDNAPLRHKFNTLLTVWREHRVDTPLRIRAMLYDLICDIMMLSEPTVSDITSEIIRYIAEHLAEPDLRLKRLCDIYYISESQLRRNLLRATGLSPNEYITRLRMERAAGELSYGGKSIKAVAASCGFASPYYFSRCFRETYGISPSEWKKNHIL